MARGRSSYFFHIKIPQNRRHNHRGVDLHHGDRVEDFRHCLYVDLQ